MDFNGKILTLSIPTSNMQLSLIQRSIVDQRKYTYLCSKQYFQNKYILKCNTTCYWVFVIAG